MNRLATLALVAVTVLPGPCLLVLCAFSLLAANGSSADPGVIILFVTLVGLLLALTVFYVVHVLQNASFTAADKKEWAYRMIGWGIVAFPMYWWLRVWKPTSGSEDRES